MFTAIRRTSLKNLIIPLFSVIAAVVIYVCIPFSDVFDPITVKSAAEAVELYNSGHSYARITVEELNYTGFDIKDGDLVKASYYYEITNNKCTYYLLDDELVKKKPMQLTNVSINVRLSEKDGLFENMMSAFALNLGWSPEGMAGATNSIVIDQTSYNIGTYAVLYVMIILVIIYGVVLVTSNLLFICVPYVHPVFIKYCGSRSYSIIKTINILKNDLENNVILQAGDMYITDNNFFNLGKNEVSIISLKKVVTCYEHGKLRSVFGIHLKISHTLYMRGYSYEKLVATGKETTDIAEVMDFLKEKYPSIIWGHTKENKIIVRNAIKEYREQRKLEKQQMKKPHRN